MGLIRDDFVNLFRMILLATLSNYVGYWEQSQIIWHVKGGNVHKEALAQA
jgi:hypothetical protein